VQPTTQSRGTPFNNDLLLEKEADIMGAAAVQTQRKKGRA